MEEESQWKEREFYTKVGEENREKIERERELGRDIITLGEFNQQRRYGAVYNISHKSSSEKTPSVNISSFIFFQHLVLVLSSLYFLEPHLLPSTFIFRSSVDSKKVVVN